MRGRVSRVPRSNRSDFSGCSIADGAEIPADWCQPLAGPPRTPSAGSVATTPGKDTLMQILHPFAGSVEQYLKEVSDPDHYRPDHCPQCDARQPLTGHG